MAKIKSKSEPGVKATVVVSDKVAKAIEVIKNHQPHVKVAYFNGDGEYHFHKRKGFSAVVIQDDDNEQEIQVEEYISDPVVNDKLEF